MSKIFFTPGPTELHPVAREAIRKALDSGICSISHRSKEYEKIQVETENQLRKLLSVPKDYKIFFLSSGTEAWEVVLQNGVKNKSYHLVNGSFSKRFFETAQELGKTPSILEKPLGTGFDLSDLPQNIDAEVICATQNETSTGVCLEEGFLEKLHDKYPEKLIAVDAVSSAPYPRINLQKIDYYFFSVQKFFCLPAGLGVLIVSPRAMEKAREVQGEGVCIGAHHSLLSLAQFSEKHQTPCTPNVLAIYTLGKVAEKMNQEGIESIRAQTQQKANLIYDLLDQHKTLKAFVAEARWRSKTVITVECGKQTQELVAALEAKGFVVGLGYGELKESQIRVANFGGHGLEDLERLLREMKKIN